jgi:alpha-methylacyl-CoA racemase
VVLEGYRPGVMERLGLGPDIVLARNPALVYARMTGWGQSGPLSAAVGHDINYIAISGALAAIGPVDRPVPPLNLVGDYGGGALYLLNGVLAALLAARASGRGQVVDCAMVDGVSSLMSLFQGWRNGGQWRTTRESNLLDGAAHFYRTYRCSDGASIAVGAIEPQFYAALRRLAELDDPVFDDQLASDGWARAGERLAEVFARRTRDEWCVLLEGTDACVSPVLTMDEAAQHPHIRARGSMVEIDGALQSAPAPRFGGTPSRVQGPPPTAPSDVDSVLVEWRTASTSPATVVRPRRPIEQPRGTHP